MHIATLMLGASTWGYAFFDFGTYPDWAPSLADLAVNATTPNPCGVDLATVAATVATLA